MKQPVNFARISSIFLSRISRLESGNIFTTNKFPYIASEIRVSDIYNICQITCNSSLLLFFKKNTLVMICYTYSIDIDHVDPHTSSYPHSGKKV